MIGPPIPAAVSGGVEVFRAEDGRVFTEDGRELTDAESDKVRWKDNAPSWEAHQERKRAHEEARTEYEIILRYQRDVLDPARERMSDPDSPPSVEELEDIERRIETEMPDAVRARRNVTQAVADDLDAPGFVAGGLERDDSGLDAPALGKAFADARETAAHESDTGNEREADLSIPTV